MTIRVLLITLFMLSGCTVKQEDKAMENKQIIHEFSLKDFYGDNKMLHLKVDSLFAGLTEEVRIAQMIITSAGENGKPAKSVEQLLQDKIIGGIVMLKGEKDSFTRLTSRFDSLARESGLLPLLFSADAEPSLFNLKIRNVPIVPKTIELASAQECKSVAKLITGELRTMGIRHNFAPVVDISPSNEAITNRTFGNDSARVVSLAGVFIAATQAEEVAATAKHFPGHGLVKGDTHKQLVYIDGAMEEVRNYIPLIEGGVISIMIGHIAVRNNGLYDTDGLPASCSRNIVNGLLKDSLDFKGIIITDAMNMGAVQKTENASLKAVEAGCDMILMEPDEKKLHSLILEKYRSDNQFHKQVDASVRKIIRLKICLNLI